MENPATIGRREYSLASRKAEEAALRRYQASHWLECLVGPLGLSSQPSEREFISCLRNGLVLCKLMNKIQPGSVSKVVVNQSSSNSQAWDSQPLPAYQYFENVRNFLAAIEALKLPAFDASIFERDNIQDGSSTKIVDCILALKAYHEWQQMTGDNGMHKPLGYPFVVHLSGRANKQPVAALKPSDGFRQSDVSASSNEQQQTGRANKQPVAALKPSDGFRQSDVSASSNEQQQTGRANKKPSAALKPSDGFRQSDASASTNEQQETGSENQKMQELIVKVLAQHMVDTKENIDNDIISSFQNGKVDAEFFGKIVSTCLEQQIQKKFPELKSEVSDIYKGKDSCTGFATSCPPQDFLNNGNQRSCRSCLRNGHCKHWNLIGTQEKELQNLKALLSTTKKDFKDLQAQLENDLKQIGGQVQEMSYAAQKYHKVVEENRNLYNMVQDMKGNIRVYCRIRPAFSAAAQTVVDFIGQDGSLVIVDPFKQYKDGRKSFHFNHVFGPSATQDDVFRETQPLIRSVMDGYNVCIFAYGQTGSGKTYTMCGPSCGSTGEQGINYLALNDLFQLSYQRQDIIKYEMHVQMVEIYNDQVHDLLAENSTVEKLEIRSCSSDNDLALPNASIRRVTSTTDVISLMKFGETNRAVGSTAMNQHSSRSHSVLTIHVRGEDVSGSTLRSCLHLVDLAGSERVDKSGVTGEGLKEAQHINKSLSCLGDVIMALAQKNTHIPYRNSKLTLLLQNALGGHAKTLMFAHVSPEEDSFGETIGTLKFAQRVSTVELGAATANKESSEVLELKSQIESLRAELGSNEPIIPLRSKPKEVAAKTPNGGSNLLQETPLRARRLSIESYSNVKTPNGRSKLLQEKTPPRTRRLSIENCSNAKTPNGRPKLLHDKTPPRTTRRLSIENCSNAREEKMNFDCRRRPKTPPIQPRPRRLSLEGPRPGYKLPVQTKLLDTVNKSVNELKRLHVNENKVSSTEDSKSPRPPRSPTNASIQVLMGKPDVTPKTVHPPRSPTKRSSFQVLMNKPDVTPKMVHPPQSPTKSSFQVVVDKPDVTPKMLHPHETKTSEPMVTCKIEGQHNRINSEHGLLSDLSTTGSSNNSTHGKGSQIRKSLRSIGKLIHGSERRNQQKLKLTEEAKPVPQFPKDAKSPISSNARATRRQSLIGVLPSESSRRSSLGGADGNRNSRTPPPDFRASMTLTNRWM